MKAVILNGARADEPHIDAVHHMIVHELGRIGGDVSTFTLRDEKISYCIGCFGCWVKSPGECIIDDDNHAISSAVINSDLYILLTPVVFGSYSSELKRMLDHTIPLILPFFQRINGEVHHAPRYHRYPDLLGIGVQSTPNPSQAAIFRSLVERNAINMHTQRHASAVWQASTPVYALRQSFQQLLAVNILEAVS